MATSAKDFRVRKIDVGMRAWKANTRSNRIFPRLQARSNGEGTSLDRIQVRRDPGRDTLDRMGVYNWPIWSCESGDRFDWTFLEATTAYVVDGAAAIVPLKGGREEAVVIRADDLVFFPGGYSCTWEILGDFQIASQTWVSYDEGALPGPKPPP